MIVKCEKYGTREKCPTCEHGVPHTFRVGCDGGNCYPPIMAKDIDGVDRPAMQNYDCIEIKEVDI